MHIVRACVASIHGSFLTCASLRLLNPVILLQGILCTDPHDKEWHERDVLSALHTVEKCNGGKTKKSGFASTV